MFQPDWKKKRVYLKKEEKEKIVRDLEHMVCWIDEKLKVDIIFDADAENEYEPDEKMIFVNSRANYRAQLHTLLHEAGHARMMLNKKKYKKQFAYFNNKKSRDKGRSFKVETMREEVLAWEEGLIIAKKAGITVDEVWYDRHRQDALWSYMEWLVKPKRSRICVK